MPTIIASPFHNGGNVNSNPYEHLSFIKMIQRRFGLSMAGSSGVNPIMSAARDTATRDLTNSLDEAGAGQGGTNGTTTGSTGTSAVSSSSSTGSSSNTGTNGAASASTFTGWTAALILAGLMAAVL